MRKYLKIFITVAVVLLPAFLEGCVESQTEPDTSVPTISVISPKSNDTMYVGDNTVSYSATDDNLRYFELYVNSKFVKHYDMNSDGTVPVISVTLDSALAGKRIQYFIKAYDGTNSKSSDTMLNILVSNVVKKPASPGDLKITYFSNDQSMVNITWTDSSNNESGFELWRKDNYNAYRKLQTLPANTVSTNDSKLIDTIFYTYKIRAVNSRGYSESSEVSIRLVDPKKPLAPSQFTAQALSSVKVRLKWTNNATNSIGIIIERRKSNGTFQQIALVDSYLTEWDDDTVLSGITYYYRIKTKGYYSESDYCDNAEVTTP
jgi:hypothetical protein